MTSHDQKGDGDHREHVPNRVRRVVPRLGTHCVENDGEGEDEQASPAIAWLIEDGRARDERRGAHGGGGDAKTEHVAPRRLGVVEHEAGDGHVHDEEEEARQLQHHLGAPLQHLGGEPLVLGGAPRGNPQQRREDGQVIRVLRVTEAHHAEEAAAARVVRGAREHEVNEHARRAPLLDAHGDEDAAEQNKVRHRQEEGAEQRVVGPRMIDLQPIVSHAIFRVPLHHSARFAVNTKRFANYSRDDASPIHHYSLMDNSGTAASSAPKQHFAHSAPPLSSSLPPHIAADYNYMSTSVPMEAAPRHDLGGGFAAMPSGAAQGPFMELPDLRNQVTNVAQHEHREDGYEMVNGMPTYYGKAWMDEQTLRHRLLTEDPEYSFVNLVAGFSGRKAEKLFDRDALDSQARRMLQRASVADELAKAALTDLDRTQKLLKDFHTESAAWLKDLATMSRANAEVNFYVREWQNYVMNTNPQLNRQMYPKRRGNDAFGQWGPTMDIRFSFVARCLYPVEGLDSTHFAQRFLNALGVMSADARMLHFAPNDAQVRAARDDASQRNPMLIQLAAYCAFAVHAAGTSSASQYIVKRMHSNNVFPAAGDYAKDKSGDMFCRDLEKLVSLFATDTMHCVSMLNMSALLFIHLRCMERRWFGPRDEPLPSDAKAATDDPCQERPRLQKPKVPRALRRNGNAAAFLTDEDDEEEALFYVEGDEGSTLLQQQKRRLETTEPEQFQNLLAIVLGPVFRHGLVTLVFDMARLREMLCDSAKQIHASLLCDDAEEKLRALLRVSRAQNTQSAAVTLAYFFGGVNLDGTGTAPHHTWANDEFGGNVRRSPVYYLINTTLHFYKRAIASLFPMQDVENQQNREWFTPPDIDVRNNSQAMYERRVQSLFAILQCTADAMRVHMANRNDAFYQSIGAVDIALNVVRMYASMRETHMRLAEVTVPQFANNVLAQPAEPLPAYLNAVEEQSVVENKTDQQQSAMRRLIVLMSRDPGRVAADLARVREEVDGTVQNLKNAIHDKNNNLLQIENAVLRQVRQKYNVQIDGNNAIAVAQRLKEVFSETYVPSADWATRPENTGVVLLSAEYLAAVEKAYTEVQRWVPNLAQASLDDLKCNETTRVTFAELVASGIGKIEVDNPATLTLNRVPDDLAKRRREIVHRLQELEPLPHTGLGTRGGRIEGRTSANGGGGGDGGFWPPGPMQWAINPPSSGLGALDRHVPVGPYGHHVAAQPARGGGLGALPSNTQGTKRLRPRNDFVLDQQNTQNHRRCISRPDRDAVPYDTHEFVDQGRPPNAVDRQLRMLEHSQQATDRVRDQMREHLQRLQEQLQTLTRRSQQVTDRETAADANLAEARNLAAQIERQRQELARDAREAGEAARLLRDMQRLGRRGIDGEAAAAAAQRRMDDVRALEDLLRRQERITDELQHQRALTVEDEEHFNRIRENIQRRIDVLQARMPAVLQRQGEHTLLAWQAEAVEAEAPLHTARLILDAAAAAAAAAQRGKVQ